jgi:putative redox protein
MSLHKVFFKNNDGQNLSGRLELPIDRHPHNFVLFAHCFTCNKHLLAIKNISRMLTAAGFGVLRFDFTGLGESEGDFSETTFSGNVEDLVAAAVFLEENYKAPTVIIGHSLGGAAVLFAASKIQSITAVATINAPSDPNHVQHLFKSSLKEIKNNGKAIVNFGGRDFTITQKFVNDIASKSLLEVVKKLKKAILIIHSPQDTIVSIDNAEKIYQAANHPKSFVSIDGADHMLSKREDSLYVGRVIASWASRYVIIPKENSLSSSHQVVASLDADEGLTTQLKLGRHYITADESKEAGGNDFGPAPHELVGGGLAACTAMTLQLYARLKKWDLQNITVHVSHKKITETETNTFLDQFDRILIIKGNLDQQQKNRLLEIANRCPVHKTLTGKIKINTKIAD